jgi:hypothetical protein
MPKVNGTPSADAPCLLGVRGVVWTFGPDVGSYPESVQAGDLLERSKRARSDEVHPL